MTDVETITEIRQSSLGDTLRRSGATMGERDGWAVALSFGDVKSEYSAVRDGGAGVLDMSARGRINVSGAEAIPFLNGLITNDVKTLAEGMWMQAAFPTVQGRLLGNSRVMHRADGFLFDTEAATHGVVLKTLERFTLAGDFRVTDLTDTLAMVSVQGARAANIMDKVFGLAASKVERGHVMRTEWNGHAVDIIRASHTSEDGFDLFIEVSMAPALWSASEAAGALPVGRDAFEILRIENGTPLFGIDVDETNVVLEAGLDEAVSFTKGCYIGQEIIARIHWRGHVAKKISGLLLNGDSKVTRDNELHTADGKSIGRITSATFSPRLGRYVALCIVKYDYLANGTEIVVTSVDGEHSAVITDLPLVRGSWYDSSLLASEPLT